MTNILSGILQSDSGRFGKVVPTIVALIVSSFIHLPFTQAQETSFPMVVFHSNLIHSWCSDPLMSQTEEDRIVSWLRSRPKSVQPIETIYDLRVELLNSARLAIDTNLYFDFKSMEEMGIRADYPASLEEGEISMTGADLLSILEPLGLTFLIRGKMIEITTRDDADVHPAIRIYDITPMLPAIRQNGRSVVSASPIIDAIQTTIEPDCWECLGGRGTIQASVVGSKCLLIIAVPSSVHLQVQCLLDRLAFAGSLQPTAQLGASVPRLTSFSSGRHESFPVIGSRAPYASSSIPVSNW